MIRDTLESYGIDYDITMRRFMNNEQTYLRFLGMFFEDDSLSKLGEAMESGDQKAAFEAAHTLKGVTGNMGLTPLYDAVCLLVEPLRKGTEASQLGEVYENVLKEHRRAKGMYQTLLKGE